MEITILSREEIDHKEKDIQAAFEKDLSKLEEGLVFIETEVIIGSGRIDTLAFDTNNNQPVFIEYKREGGFGRDALIQSMDYLSWFLRDENRFAVLERIIRRKKPDISEFNPAIRLIIVVDDIEERVKNAIYALSNHVVVYSYALSRDSGGNIILIPKAEVDNSEIEGPIPEPKHPDELIKTFPQLNDLWKLLKTEIEREGVVSYTTSHSFRFKKDRIFAKARPRQKYIQLELRVGKGVLNDPMFKYWRQGESAWGWLKVYPMEQLPEKIRDWIKIACDYSSVPEEETTEEE